MEQYVFQPAPLPHMSNQEGAAYSMWCDGREDGKGELVFMSESSVTHACFAALMYANSTCRLWDKALDATKCNFLPFLLWKYFDGGRTRSPPVGKHSSFAQVGILQSWLADCQIFTSHVYGRELRPFTVKMGMNLLFPLRLSGWKIKQHSHVPSTWFRPSCLSSLSRCIISKIHNWAQTTGQVEQMQKGRNALGDFEEAWARWKVCTKTDLSAFQIPVCQDLHSTLAVGLENCF